MLELAPASRDNLVQSLGLNRRLAARVGSLMGKGIACTRALLEESRENPELTRLLLAPDLRTSGEDVETILSRLLEEPEFAALRKDLPLTVAEQDRWRVIALAEEVEAEVAFEAATEAQTSDPDKRARALERRPDSAALVFDESVGLEAAFPPERLAELRVEIFAGETSAERVAALRRLAFAPIDEQERTDIFIQALAEEDPQLRAAAANALRALGMNGDVTEAIRLLAEGDEEERRYAAGRLTSAAREGGHAAVRAGAMCLLGTLRTEEHLPVREGAIRGIGQLAPRMQGFAEVEDELLRILLEQVVAHRDSLGGSVRQALQSFESARPGSVAVHLLEEARQTEDLQLRGHLLSMASTCQMTAETRLAYRNAVISALLELPAESPSARPLGAFLLREGHSGLRMLADKLPEADVAHQRSFVRMLDNAARFQEVSDEVRVEIARHLLVLLRSASRPLLADIFESRLTAPDALSGEERVKMARAILDASRQFALPQVLEHVENSLIRLGVDALQPLLETIQNRPNTADAGVAASALGRLASNASEANPKVLESMRAALRKLQEVSFNRSGAMPQVFLAMGRMLGTGLFDAEIAGVVRRNLLNRLEGSTKDAPLIAALGWAASSPQADAETLNTVLELALGHLEKPPPESTMERDIVGGEEIFRFSGDVDVFADLIPSCLEAMQHAVLSPALDESTFREIAERLIALWEECSSFRRQWSPGNVAQLTAVLGAIGRAPQTPDDLRNRVIRTLARRLNTMPVLESLADIVRDAGPGEEMDRIAAAVATRILKFMEEEDSLTAEVRETYLNVLARVAGRGRFTLKAGRGERLMSRVLDEIIAGLREGVPGSMGHAMELRENESLPRALRDVLAEEIRAHTAVARSS
jgi:hypothetical protein